MRQAVIGLSIGLFIIILIGSKPSWADIEVSGLNRSQNSAVIQDSPLTTGGGSFTAVKGTFFAYGLFKPPYFQRYYYKGDYFLYPVEVTGQDIRGLILAGGVLEVKGIRRGTFFSDDQSGWVGVLSAEIE